MKKIFSVALLVIAAAASNTVSLVQASPSALVSKKDYIMLSQARPAKVPVGKVEVIEFMSYSCPHCREFDLYLEKWKTQKCTNIVFRRVPVALNKRFIPHSKMLLALDVLGLSDELAPAIFREIHINKNRLLNLDEQVNFLIKKSVNEKKYLDAYHSSFVKTELQRVLQLAQDYKIDNVPTIVVQGKYKTGPAVTNSLEHTVQVLEYLVEQVVKNY
ncbi:thiol:disulfide interchange protein DsbA/DsbL [Candidatus Vallotiella sp. (ex Adelges kitamiensis)]|uniref:thiol:disulfide interchange protein DsbA/DsbL n=1 Tax=Candidatus Vallotiella sp. (ex Adelges kitamiensis) TaxID=2864217 RepID=UPI001CE2651C|nr:thiol:disulfide interchange protein DsbA/DsbL [Candidatus Vallotia sp. (ex Adelges kitamiensis)]